MRNLFRLTLRLLIRGSIILVLLFFTTYGWARTKDVKEFSLQEKQQIQQNLKATVIHLSETIGIRNYQYFENLNTTADYIISTFKRLGYHVEVMEYWVGQQVFRNITAREKKEPDNAGVILVGAHYDSCFNPGADDNASGIAAVLELARLMKDYHGTKSIRFVAFANEEPPFFMTENMGSFVYAKKMKAQGVDIDTVIIFDMLGYYRDEKHSQRYPPLIGLFYPNKGNFLAVVGNFPSGKVVKQIVKSYENAASIPVRSIVAPGFIPGLSFSDHWAFWKHGYRAVMLTDTAYLRNKNYHKQSDLPNTLRYEKIMEVVIGVKAFLDLQ